MRVLLIHSDYLKYKTKNKSPIAEEIEEIKKEGIFEESLVVFTAVEKEDEKNPNAVIENLIAEIKKVNSQVKAENIVLYPYAHLSSSLSSPDSAIAILKEVESTLIHEGFDTFRVPFGWYKSFEISCKGHPLSELSRTIVSEEIAKAKDDDEEESEFYILDDGELHKTEDYDYRSSDLEKIMEYELGIGNLKT